MTKIAIGFVLLLCGCDVGGGLLIAHDVAPAHDDAGTPPQCSGDDPADLCDDCNPCTTDANCIPCDTLPAGVAPTIYNCGGYSDGSGAPLSGACYEATGALRAPGCYHLGRTTPTGQDNDCFPAESIGTPTSGHCCAGVCDPNGEACL